MMNNNGFQQSHQLITQLFERMAAFVAVQQEHAACLAENRLKNLMKWRQQRTLSFRQLKQVLDQVITLDECDSSAREKLGVELKKIVENENRLAELVVIQRERLQNSLRNMRKGKQMLKGYSVYQGGGPKPRYVSNKS